MSQKSQVREYLEQGNSITQKDAIEMFNAYRLSAIIFDLKEDGLSIDMERVKGVNSTYGSYSLV